ncbi:serum response factor-binding protein 1-like [Bolinopsis microptera]|uniref:serum response factor-binding protein 1-like n=1 Tax=Bolinopsis microptera TaxID=2820187 RepID=UPI00307A7325
MIESADKSKDDVPDPEISSEYSSDEAPDPEISPEPPTVPSEIAHKHLVTMQRLAKKRRVFLVQKITKRIKLLKNKKGNEAQLSKNQRKVERLFQRINDMKVLDFKDVVSEMVKQNFKISDNHQEQTKEWFLYELTQDKSSFMYFVNSLDESNNMQAEGNTVNNSSIPKRELPSSNGSPKKKKPKKDDFSNKLSSFSEKGDNVLNDIIKEKRNRPGQRARQKQWEEVYGIQAKHLSKDKRSNDTNKRDSNKRDGNKRDIGKSKKRAPVDLPPQEIMKRLKEKEKEKEKEKVSVKAEHPSWLAKKQLSSLTSKIDVFAGKKTTFSDDDD